MVPQGQNPKEISTEKEKEGQVQKNESGFEIKTGSVGRSTGRFFDKLANNFTGRQNFCNDSLPELLIILNSKAHLIWPKSAQKGAQFFSPKKSHIFGERRTIFDPPNNFYCIFMHKFF